MKRASSVAVLLLLQATLAAGQRTAPATPAHSSPKVIVIGLNGGELDFILPLAFNGKMPNLRRVIDQGVYGRLRTMAGAVCPKIYSTFETGLTPEEHGITGFFVEHHKPASTDLLRGAPLWQMLSEHGITVGYANVPATFPAQPVRGYMISGMDTIGPGCKDGNLCPVKMSEAQEGKAVWPQSLESEVLREVGDVVLDCERIPSAEELEQPGAVEKWLGRVREIRNQQARLFSYLLEHHPTDFTFFVQSCEDRTGHWLYPINSWNTGFDPEIQGKYRDAFADQYIAFDWVLGEILRHVDGDTTLLVISDHGIKPLHEGEDYHGGMKAHFHDNSVIVAHHDFADGDDVPGMFFAMGPHIRKGVQIKGFGMSVYDIAPTILALYGIKKPSSMKGRVLDELFTESAAH